MEVIRAKVLGYCMGVRRAVDAAKQALLQNQGTGRKVYTLGPLIHNPLVLDKLAAEGLSVLSEGEVDNIDSRSVVLIRAHGTSPAVMERLRLAGSEVIDATCPRVHLSQQRAREWSAKGYEVIIAGDKNHGEVLSISGFAASPVVVVQDAEEARRLELPEKSILIAQTTFSPAVFAEISTILLKKNPSLVVYNSICSATMERQKALLALQGRVDGILVVGGKNSANTRRLYETAARLCGRVALIEDESQLPVEFCDGKAVKVVGITAGASTPEEVIAAVEKKLIKL